MPFLKFKCESCGKVRRAYEGKCLGAKSEGCSGNCSCCSGCHH